MTPHCEQKLFNGLLEDGTDIDGYARCRVFAQTALDKCWRVQGVRDLLADDGVHGEGRTDYAALHAGRGASGSDARSRLEGARSGHTGSC